MLPYFDSSKSISNSLGITKTSKNDLTRVRSFCLVTHDVYKS